MKTRKRDLLIAVFILMFVFSFVYAEYIPFKVKLTALERLVVSTLLPEQTSFTNWKIINDLKEQLAPSENELAKLNIKNNDNGGVIANWDAVPEKEIIFGEATEKMVIDALKKLDAESKLLPEHISLYKKFVLKETK